ISPKKATPNQPMTHPMMPCAGAMKSESRTKPTPMATTPIIRQGESLISIVRLVSMPRRSAPRSTSKLTASIHVDDGARKIRHLRCREHDRQCRYFLRFFEAAERQATEQFFPAVLVAERRFCARLRERHDAVRAGRGRID